MLAHPLRTRLLAELRAAGPATATALAAALGTNTGSTSYHLRRLESAGLVTDTGTGTGKERVWAAAENSPGLDWPAGDDADSRAALSWIERDYVRHVAGKADAWLDVAPTWPREWTAHLGLRDHAVLVGTKHLATMLAEVAQVIERYRRVGQGNPDAKRVAVYTFTYPVDFAAPPRRDG
jgi:DNA-binding Lrp family transcriptional regulator